MFAGKNKPPSMYSDSQPYQNSISEAAKGEFKRHSVSVQPSKTAPTNRQHDARLFDQHFDDDSAGESGHHSYAHPSQNRGGGGHSSQAHYERDGGRESWNDGGRSGFENDRSLNSRPRSFQRDRDVEDARRRHRRRRRP